jgi:hypothetical protein
MPKKQIEHLKRLAPITARRLPIRSKLRHSSRNTPVAGSRAQHPTTRNRDILNRTSFCQVRSYMIDCELSTQHLEPGACLATKRLHGHL